MSAFPVDDVTLLMLREALRTGDDGRTHLVDFLTMGEAEPLSERIVGDAGGTPIVEVEYAEGQAPWGPHDVIQALLDEVLRLRDLSTQETDPE